MISNAGKEKQKPVDPTPLSSMYYNDPQYANKITGIEGKISPDNLTNSSQARIGNNGMTAPSGMDQQSSDSLIQNIHSDLEGDKQIARPATKDDFVIHTVKISDTLERLCIQYDVNKDAIKMANDFLGEEIYMFKTLKIPFTYGEVYHVPPDKDEEEEKKEWAQEQFHQVIRDTNLDNENYTSEVKYYLEMNNYNMEEAMRQYDLDMKFEKQVKTDNQRYILNIFSSFIIIFYYFLFINNLKFSLLGIKDRREERSSKILAELLALVFD